MLALFTLFDTLLDEAALGVREAEPTVGVVVVSTLLAVSVGIGLTVGVSQLAFLEWVQEIESVTVDAVTFLGELPTVLIGVFAFSLSVGFVTLVALLASASVSSSHQTLGIVKFAGVFLSQGISLLAADTLSILHPVTVDHLTEFF